MKITSIPLLLCAMSFGATSLQAGLVSPSPDTLLTNRGNGPYTVGFDFTVSADRTINALGVEDSLDDGLAIDSEAGLWDITEIPSVQLATVTIPTGTEATLEEGFRYMPIGAAITLIPGRTYRIGAVVSAQNAFTDTADAGGSGAGFTGTGVTILTNRYAVGGVLAEPVRDGGGDTGRWAGGNATFLATQPLEIIDFVLDLDADTFSFVWSSLPDTNYGVFESSDLKTWNELDDSWPSEGETTEYVRDVDTIATPRLYFRVVQAP